MHATASLISTTPCADRPSFALEEQKLVAVRIEDRELTVAAKLDWFARRLQVAGEDLLVGGCVGHRSLTEVKPPPVHVRSSPLSILGLELESELLVELDGVLEILDVAGRAGARPRSRALSEGPVQARGRRLGERAESPAAAWRRSSCPRRLPRARAQAPVPAASGRSGHSRGARALTETTPGASRGGPRTRAVLRARRPADAHRRSIAPSLRTRKRDQRKRSIHTGYDRESSTPGDLWTRRTFFVSVSRELPPSLFWRLARALLRAPAPARLSLGDMRPRHHIRDAQAAIEPSFAAPPPVPARAWFRPGFAGH